MENQEEKIELKRVLWLSDFACSTGFANVAQNIAAQILKTKKYQIDIIGINYFGMPTEWNYAYPSVRIFPASLLSKGDVFGRQALLNLLTSGQYDLVFILQDTFNIEPIGQTLVDIKNKLISEGKKPFKWIFYFPIDATPKENWITKSVSLADIPVVYTNYGYDECVKQDPNIAKRLKVMPHGTDTGVFKPMDKEDVARFRHSYFVGKADGKFLITNVNRNQPRKDIARTLQIYALVKQQVPNAMLYLHMKAQDVGGNIIEMGRNFGLTQDDFLFPQNFDEHDGLPLETMNYIYNASDLVMTTTLGEGWGLSVTEAMACKVPVVAPNNTSLTEILENRGTLMGCGTGISEWFVMSSDNERLRPLTNVADAVYKIVTIAQNYKEYKDKADKAYEFLINNWTWDSVGERWRNIFEEALAIPDKKLRRNDPCWCESGKKFKNCHGAR